MDAFRFVDDAACNCEACVNDRREFDEGAPTDDPGDATSSSTTRASSPLSVDYVFVEGPYYRPTCRPKDRRANRETKGGAATFALRLRDDPPFVDCTFLRDAFGKQATLLYGNEEIVRARYQGDLRHTSVIVDCFFRVDASRFVSCHDFIESFYLGTKLELLSARPYSAMRLDVWEDLLAYTYDSGKIEIILGRRPHYFNLTFRMECGLATLTNLSEIDECIGLRLERELQQRMDEREEDEEAGEQVAFTQPICALCRRASRHVCSLCKDVFYCSEECQAQDWDDGSGAAPPHRLTCRGRRVS